VLRDPDEVLTMFCKRIGLRLIWGAR